MVDGVKHEQERESKIDVVTKRLIYKIMRRQLKKESFKGLQVRYTFNPRFSIR